MLGCHAPTARLFKSISETLVGEEQFVGRLSGKIAVITGGAAGIGQAFAQRLAADGADVSVADITDASRTQELVEREGVRFLSMECDITDPLQVATFQQKTSSDLGPATILVNNAGIFPLTPFEDLTFSDWRAINAVNVDAMFLVSQAFVGDMIAAKQGRIVNMSSTVCWLKIEHYVHYITTKAAAIGFTRGLANELGKHNITVNSIAPSLVKNATTEASSLSGMFDAVTQTQAIERLQVPSDLAGALSFLVSDDAEFITGQTLVVDGGMIKN